MNNDVTQVISDTTNKNDLLMMLNYRRLENIRRCNNLPTINTVDVAQHSFYTALLAVTLASDYNVWATKNNLQYHPLDFDNHVPTIDGDKAMKKALFHDLEESFTSDIPWNVKHHDEKAHEAITECIHSKLNKVYDGCSSVIMEHKHFIETCKDKTIEGQLVDLVDSLECAWYCYQEVSMGNKYLGNMLNKCVRLIEAMPLYEKLYKASPIFKSMIKLFDNLAKSNCDKTMNID